MGLKKTLLSILSVLVVLVCLELLTILAKTIFCFGPSTIPFVFDPVLGWKHEAGADGVQQKCNGFWYEYRQPVHFNSLGLRDRKLSYENSTDNPRVLLLGDSITEALQVPLEDTFARRLEGLLRATEPDIEVINGGVSAYSASNELLFYQSEGRRYAADLVVLVFNLQNDVYENSYVLTQASYRRARWRAGTQREALIDAETREIYFDSSKLDDESELRKELGISTLMFRRPGRLQQLAKHSHLAQLLDIALLRRRTSARGGNRAYSCEESLRSGAQEDGSSAEQSNAVSNSTTAVVGDEPRTPGQLVPLAIQRLACRSEYPLYYDVFKTDVTPAWNWAWRITQRLIQEIAQEVQADGARFAVAVVPTRLSVDPDIWTRSVEREKLDVNVEWDVDYPRRRIVEFLEDNAIETWDLTPNLRSAYESSGVPQFYEIDVHLNSRGHETVADALADAIRSYGLNETR